MRSADDSPPARAVLTRHPVRDWEDALISGNGRQGALVHSTPECVRLTLGHERLFLPVTAPLPAPHTAPHLPRLRELLRQGRSAAVGERIVELAEREGYRGTHWIDPLVGAAVLELAPDPPGRGEVLRSCDLNTGLVTERLPDGTTLRAFVSRPDETVVVELDRPRGMTGLLRLAAPPGRCPVPLRTRTRARTDSLRLDAAFPDRPAGTISGYTVRCDLGVEGGRVRPQGEGLRLEGVLRLRAVLRTEVLPDRGETDPGPAAGSRPGRALAEPFERALERHGRVHGAMMDRFRLRIEGRGTDAARVVRLVDAGRYAVISSCGELPPTLQGVWSGSYDPPWRSGYTFDGNLPSVLAALHPTGTPELMTGLFDLLDGMRADFEENARRLYGCRGLLVPAHASTSGRHNHFGPVWSLTCWTSGAAWLARLYWDHFSHTRDRDFLRRRALPFLTGAAEFYEDFLTGEGFLPSYSPENQPGDGDGQACANATMDLASARDLLRNLARAHRELGLPGARRWLRLRAGLPRYRVARDGELAEWATGAGPVSQSERHGHRHASHLYPLWYETDPALSAGPLREAARRTVRARLAWWRGAESDEMAFGLVQLGLAAAALGMAEEALETLDLMADGYWRPSLVSTHNRGALFNVDICGGYPAVVTAMLARSGEGRLDLLPALPRGWDSGRVEGLRARGGVVVDRLEWGGGRFEAELRAVEPHRVRVAAPDGARWAMLGPQEPTLVSGHLRANLAGE